MKVNLGVELSDEQRRVLASLIAGKPVKRMASRDDVREFLVGVIAAVQPCPVDEAMVTAMASDSPEATAAGRRVQNNARAPYSEEELRIVERLTIGEGRPMEYARGFISAGRVLAQNGHRLRVTS